MYPNPQDALPLPPDPSVEWYRKHAKDLLAAARSDEADAIRAWADRWVRRSAAWSVDRPAEGTLTVRADQLTRFAREQLLEGADSSATVARAQFVIARAIGFASWTRFVRHLEASRSADSPGARFESAVDAIVSGDLPRLTTLLRNTPDLVRARSTREHDATLLHYVSANGVETYRQRTPPNAVEIARLLLDAGAEVDAEADVYGGGSTTLGLVATSQPPRNVGVQLPLIDLLLERGARTDLPSPAGNRHGIVNACLHNGCPEAAAHLAGRGAKLDLEGAAGTGRLDVVRDLLDADEARAPDAAARAGALATASAYGHASVAELLIERGVQPETKLSFYGTGHTALHLAAYEAHVEVATTLLRHGAPVRIRDESWDGTLHWALYGWRNHPDKPTERYHEVVRALLGAGAPVEPDMLNDERTRADATMIGLLTGTP
jgi:hypothetical protein